MKKFLGLILIVNSLFLQSCATLFSGTKDQINIQSQPSGAKVEVGGVYVGTTPCVVTMKRKNDGFIILKKEGYRDKTATLQKSFNAISILNLTDIVGWVIDLSTGAINKFEPTSYNFELDVNKQQIP